jgi:hypothetical protein
MITATKTMAVELAPEGIRVNALCPVAGETPLLKSFMGEDTPEMRAKFLSTIPIGRFSTPEDMGEAAAFLCSDAASMITGRARGRWRALHMTGYVRRDLPADIAVFAGDFASQPLAFAHLLDAAPDLDLTHVEVIRDPPETRLAAYFEPATVAAIRTAAGPRDTIILILPAAHDSADCPLGPPAHLTALGTYRGTVPHMVAS